MSELFHNSNNNTQPRVIIIIIIITKNIMPLKNIPPQLRSIIQTEGRVKDLELCMKNIENAKKNELKAYLSLCDLRLRAFY